MSVRLNKKYNFDFSESKYQIFGGNPIFIPNEELINNDSDVLKQIFYDSGGIGLNFGERDKNFDSGVIIL